MSKKAQKLRTEVSKGVGGRGSIWVEIVGRPFHNPITLKSGCISASFKNRIVMLPNSLSNEVASYYFPQYYCRVSHSGHSSAHYIFLVM